MRVFAAAGARSGRAIQTTKGPINMPDDLKGLQPAHSTDPDVQGRV